MAAPSAATVKATLETKQALVHPLAGHPKYRAPLDPGATPGGDDHRVVQLGFRTCTLDGMPVKCCENNGVAYMETVSPSSRIRVLEMILAFNLNPCLFSWSTFLRMTV